MHKARAGKSFASSISCGFRVSGFSSNLWAMTLWVAMTLTVLPSCSKQASEQSESNLQVPPAPSTVSQPAEQPLPNYGSAQPILSDQQAIQAQSEHLVNAQITITARVKKLLRDDTRGLTHQKFLLELSNGTTVLVAHNTSMAPRVPLNEGDVVTICGEYIWNRKGGLMHWTHKSDTPKHQGGWIDYAGRRYE